MSFDLEDIQLGFYELGPGPIPLGIYGMCVEDADEIPPELEFDTDGSVLIVRGTDDSGSLAQFAVDIYFPTLGIREVVYDGVKFGVKYSGVDNAHDGITDGEQVSFFRDGGWPDGQGIAFAMAVDRHGNRTYEPHTFILTNPPAFSQQTSAASDDNEIARDLELDADLDLVVTTDLQIVSGIEALKQSLTLRCGMFLGEWFIDEEEGVPYFQQIFVKNPDLTIIKEIYRRLIVETPGVLALTSLELDYQPALRELSVSFSATSDFGEFSDVITQQVP